MQRILIIGCPGSGKSTLSRALSVHTGLPVIHLDKEYFGPDWQEMPRPEWRQRVEELVAHDRWIMDGNYAGTLATRLARADLVIYLTPSPLTCLYRVLKRIVRWRGRVRPDAAPGCKERFDFDFLHYILTFRFHSARRVARLLAAHPTVPVIRGARVSAAEVLAHVGFRAKGVRPAKR